MRGLDPRIHQKMSHAKRMDCRVKPGNDGSAQQKTDGKPSVFVDPNSCLIQARQAKATLSSVRAPNFSEERATARPPSAR
jgi:hypothetical protein